MRIKKPQPFEPDRQYSPGKRAVYRGMVIIAERWVKPSDKLIEKVGKFVCLSRCTCCVIHKDDCPAVVLKCHRTSRSDNKVIYFRKLYNITEKKAMEKKRFIPFDAETFLMIEDVTGTEPEVTEKENYFELKMYAPDKEERIIEAAICAVQGRYGKRIKDVKTIKEQNLLRGAIFFVEYEKGAGNLPNELRTNLGMPDETAGDIYCRRLLEVRALPVKRDNWEKLQIFTGGGIMQIPRTPGGLAVYSFPTENGVMLDVPEGNFIVLTPDGKFGKMDMQTFMANFEEKDANTAGLTFDEKRLFEKMNKLFGKNIEKRLGKLAEEYNELFEAFERYLSREKTQREIKEINPGTHDIIDELADVNVVLFHIAALLGYSQKELQEMAYTKIAGREKNPEFMRKHPHNKPESPVCGNMQQETGEQYKHFENRFNKRL